MDHIPDIDELLELIASMRAAGTDTQAFEVKACAHDLTKDIARTLSAFSNASGGVVLCGLDEARGFAPVPGFYAKRIQDALAQCCTERMTPPVRPIIEICLLDEAPVLVAYIPEMRPKDKPCYVTASGVYGGSFIRTGDGDRRLSSYEVDRLLEEHERPRHDIRIVSDARPEDLDPELVAGLLRRERLLHERGFRGLDDQDVLRKLRVLREDEAGVLRPTIAGLVALGSYPQEFFPRLNITFSSYPGTSKTDVLPDGRRFLDAFTITGPIPYMLEDCLTAVVRNMRMGGRIESDLRYDVFDYPLVAVREAVVNALMHRDYSDEGRGSAVCVDLYADRLEIINPGGLYGAVTIATLGTTGASSTRNQFLANILESTPLASGGFVCENRGTGYRIIQSALREAGMPDPVPRDSINFFTLTMRRREDDLGGAASCGELSSREGAAARDVRDREGRSGKAGAGDMPASQARILEQVRRCGPLRMQDIAERAGVSRTTATKGVRALIERGILAPTDAKYSPHQRYGLAGA